MSLKNILRTVCRTLSPLPRVWSPPIMTPKNCTMFQLRTELTDWATQQKPIPLKCLGFFLMIDNQLEFSSVPQHKVVFKIKKRAIGKKTESSFPFLRCVDTGQSKHILSVLCFFYFCSQFTNIIQHIIFYYLGVGKADILF